MIRKDYEHMILDRVEKNFNQIMPISGIIAIVSAIAINFSTIPKSFVILDAVVGILFIVMYLYKEKLSLEFKIVLTVISAMTIGILTFMHGGFVSGAMTLIMLANIVTVLLLNRTSSLVIAALSVGVFLTMWLWSIAFYNGQIVKYGLEIWIIQFLTFVLYLTMLHTMVFAIRKYLLENIEELEDSMEQVYQYAYYDRLTGLPNQLMFKDKIRVNIEKAKTSGYLLFINLKDLALINSIYGEAIGDAVLTGTAQIFKRIKRNDEIVARISGNEFLLIFNQPVDFKKRLNEYLEEYKNRFHVPEMTKTIDFYISYMEYTHEEGILDAYQKASLALTYAKTHDIQKPIRYDENINQIFKDEETLKEFLLEAIEEEEFDIHYQEQIDAETQEVVGVEALARWNSTRLGYVSPIKFIPALERVNASVAFGNLIIHKAFSDYEKLCRKYHQNIKLSINISPSHLIAKNFIFTIKDAVIEHKIKPENIVFEITEEIMIEGFTFVQSVIDHIKSMGFKVSLDDFGSGYSSLNYLTKLDIDELKIDKSFVDQLLEDKKTEMMIKYLITLARGYDLVVVAEGVETELQYQILRKLGCHEIQGYYFSKPKALE